MTTEMTLVSAFLVGLLGSTHCIGMCGGIVGALTFGLKEDIRRSPRSLLSYLLAYNIGRIASYVTAGAVVGFLSAQAWRVTTPAHASLAARIISGGFMIALGLYLSGWWPGLGALERLGGKFWRRIEPLGRRFLPVNHPVKALLLGLVWGWLPCGMVYAALAWTLLAGSAGQGALLMLAFGLGTLPMLLALGSAARWLGEAARRPLVRQLTGALIMLFGLYTLLTPISLGHAGHAPPSDSAPVAHDQ
jgi:hypothetical protein